MFEDGNLSKFIYAILGVASIIIPGPAIKIAVFVIAVAMLIYEIKKAKESPEGFESATWSVVILVGILIFDLGFTVLWWGVQSDYNKYNYTQTSSSASIDDDMSPEELAEAAVVTYKLGHLAQFVEKENHQNEIKSGFMEFLENDIGISNIEAKGNKLTCVIAGNKIIFTITKSDIKYTVGK